MKMNSKELNYLSTLLLSIERTANAEGRLASQIEFQKAIGGDERRIAELEGQRQKLEAKVEEIRQLLFRFVDEDLLGE